MLDHAHTTSLQTIKVLVIERWLLFLVLRQVERNFKKVVMNDKKKNRMAGWTQIGGRGQTCTLY